MLVLVFVENNKRVEMFTKKVFLKSNYISKQILTPFQKKGDPGRTPYWVIRKKKSQRAQGITEPRQFSLTQQSEAIHSQ